MSNDKIVEQVREALKAHIKRDSIILEEKPVYSTDIVMSGTILPLPRFKQIATVTHSVTIFNFIDIYSDVLNSVFIRKGKRLPAMLKMKYITHNEKIIETGYNKFIQQWIDEGITL